MDIEYLIVLQNVRAGTPDIVDGFFSALSLLADGPALVAIIMVVYWCIDKRAGQFAMTAFMLGNLVTQFIKNLACVYRPWMRDARITPNESAMEGVGSYSFPSSHTAGAVTSLGSFAWLLRYSNRIISIVLVVVILLIGFSRNYLGVHAPQDVLFALAEGVLVIWLVGKFFEWFEENEDRDVFVAAIAIIASIVTLVIVIMKPYPLDYVNGQLLVDPIQMQKGSFEASGVVIGVVLGWLLERRTVRFSTDSAVIDLRGRLIRGIVGVVIVGVVYFVGNALFKAILGLLLGKLAAMLVLTFVAMFLVPFVFTWLEQTRFVPYASVASLGLPGRGRSRGRDESRGRDSARSGRASRREGTRGSTSRNSDRPSASRSGRSSDGRSGSRSGSRRGSTRSSGRTSFLDGMGTDSSRGTSERESARGSGRPSVSRKGSSGRPYGRRPRTEDRSETLPADDSLQAMEGPSSADERSMLSATVPEVSVDAVGSQPQEAPCETKPSRSLELPPI